MTRPATATTEPMSTTAFGTLRVVAQTKATSSSGAMYSIRMAVPTAMRCTAAK
jgi:hypothetical protein